MQTNLLALNAAIEAAKKTNMLIKDSIKSIESGKYLADNTAKNLLEVVSQILILDKKQNTLSKY